MHAFLIVGGTTTVRQERLAQSIADWKVMPADIVPLISEDAHITIDMVRAFQKRLLLAPLSSPHTVGTITEAHRLTTEAQQALLKLLEEPPPRARIICETETVDQLLPTIVSRCQVIRVTSTSTDQSTHELSTEVRTLMDASVADIQAHVDAHTTDREAAKQWAHDLLIGARHLLVSPDPALKKVDTQKIVRIIRNLQTAIVQLSVNCNPKLVLDMVFLSS
jgi:outer membrane murein-binding lipoprotein Lpp